VGAEIIHQHPTADGARSALPATAISSGSPARSPISTTGGVVLISERRGDAEVFLKALTIARNLHGGKPTNFTACDCDMQRHYRHASTWWSDRTLAGGRGIQLTGHQRSCFR